jgi:tRNA (guanine-N7-)-methyltransferase
MRLRKVKNASEIVNKSDYIINCPKENKGSWNNVFNNLNPIYIEIGMGKGQFIINMAISNPNINFLGIEKYDSVIVRAIEKLESLEIKPENLRLIQVDANEIAEIFYKEIDLIYLNFSDPWPKAKHAKRRLTSHEFLEKYDLIFKDQKTIIQKTDNLNLFNYSVDSLTEYGYKIESISYDLHNSSILDNIMTEYEEKFANLGQKINRLIAKK